MQKKDEFFYIKPTIPKMVDGKLHELIKDYNTEFNYKIGFNSLKEIYNKMIKLSPKAVDVKVIPSPDGLFNPNQTLIGIQNESNSHHFYYTLNQYLKLK